MKILNEVDLYRPMTLRKHMHMFCTKLEGKKERGKKIRAINVQPASVRKIKARGTSRKGRNAFEGSGIFKDRSGETANFILPSGEEIVLPGRHQKRKGPTRPEHRLSKAVKIVKHYQRGTTSSNIFEYFNHKNLHVTKWKSLM